MKGNELQLVIWKSCRLHSIAGSLERAQHVAGVAGAAGGFLAESWLGLELFDLEQEPSPSGFVKWEFPCLAHRATLVLSRCHVAQPKREAEG